MVLFAHTVSIYVIIFLGFFYTLFLVSYILSTSNTNSFIAYSLIILSATQFFSLNSDFSFL
jgi:hypothetical protein